MKIAHISDVHIRLKDRHEEYDEVFENLYDILKKKKPDLIVLTGDIVHSKITMSPELIQKLVIFFDNLQSISPVVMIPGNHDLNVRNKDRLDALTPIVDMVNDTPYENIDHGITYLKETGLFEYNDNLVFGVWSQVDGKDLILKAKNKKKDKIYIGLYHGAVVGCELDTKYILREGFATTQTFNNFDYVMLGDIHKAQVLDDNGRIRYAGSLIQQNFGEDLDKGFLLWDIKDEDNFDVEFVKIPNDWCYYTIRISDEKLPKLEDLTKNTRLRVIWDIDEAQISKSTVNSVSAMIREAYNPYSIKLDFKPKKKGAFDVDIDDTLNIRDPNVQKDILINWLKTNTELDDETIQKVVELDRTANEEILSYEFDDYANTSWTLNKIEIENFLSYANNVVIDFDKYFGVIGLFGENASGKSVLIDAILYALFNKTTRNVKGEELICKYTDDDTCMVKIFITIKNIEYIIERKTKINRDRNGEAVNSTTNVNFKRRYSKDEKWENLTGEKRFDTEKIIRNVVGEFDDFLTTTLSSQNGEYEFSEQRPAVRVENIMRFLGLDIFRKKYEYAKETIRSVEMLKSVNGDYDDISDTVKFLNEEITLLEKKAKKIDKQISTNYTEIDNLDKKIDDLKSSINNSIDIDYTEEDIKGKIFIYEKEKIDQLDLKNKSVEKLDSIKRKIDKVVGMMYSDEEYDLAYQSLDTIKSLKKDISKMKSNIKILEAELNVHKGNFVDVGCPATKDPNYITCSFLKGVNDQRITIDEKQLLIEANKNVLKNYNDKFDKIIGMEEVVSNQDVLKRKLGDLEDEVTICNLSIEKYDGRIETIDLAISVLNDKLDVLTKNIELVENNKKISKIIADEKASREKLNSDNRTLSDELSEINTNIAINRKSVETHIETLKSIASINENYMIYSNYKNAMHRRGVPIVILKQYIPKINFEINEILNIVSEFNVFFVLDNETKLDIVMKYGEDVKDTRPISMASGMEKLLINLTIRYVLLKNNFLCKCGTHFIDEGFGVLDDENIMSIQKFFDTVKESFNNIVFITHINTLKDCADHIISVSKENNISKLIHS